MYLWACVCVYVLRMSHDGCECICVWRRRDSNQNMMKKSFFLFAKKKMKCYVTRTKKILGSLLFNTFNIHFQSKRTHTHRCGRFFSYVQRRCRSRTKKNTECVRARWAFFFSHSDSFVAHFFAVLLLLRSSCFSLLRHRRIWFSVHSRPTVFSIRFFR